MDVFEAVKQAVTTRQAAEHYGIHVGRNGMACCPFHKDKTPSLKADRRFHCFGCQADGDVIDFAARLFDLSGVEAAKRLAADFGIPYDNRGRPSPKPVKRSIPAELRFLQAEQKCFRVLSDYYHLLGRWRTEHAPKSPGDAWHPLFRSLAETGVYRVSAGHAAYRRGGGKSRYYHRAWEGGGTDWKKNIRAFRIRTCST